MSDPTVPQRAARWPAGLRPLCAGVAALVLAGCAAVGPDHVRPVVAVPDAWSRATTAAPEAVPASAATAPPTAPAPPTASAPPTPPAPPVPPAASVEALSGWWRQFDDAALGDFVEQALRGTPELRAALARLEAARASRALARAQRAPTVTAGVSAQTSAANGRAATDAFGTGLDAAWELDLFGARRRALEAAEADLGAAEATLASTRVSLAAEVALAYVEVRTAQARIDVARRNLDSQAETLQLTRWRAQAGLVGALDVEQATASHAQTRAQLPVLESAFGQARHRLAVLLGRPPAALDAVLAAPKPIPTAPAGIPVSIPAAVLAQRPDVAAAERALAAETARVGVAEAARYPSLSLGASIGLQALTPGGLLDAGATTRSLFASLAATVFDAGRLRRQVEIRSAVQAQALAQYESAVLTALQEVEDALLALAVGGERRAALATAVDAARNAALLARQRYASGLADFQAVLDSGRTVLTLEDALVTSTADTSDAVVRLYKALGGGWSGAAGDERKQP